MEMKGRENSVVSTLCELSETEIIQQQIQAIRTERYALQSVAKDILPNERVKICLRHIVADNVEVKKHLKTDKAFYSGLMICGSIWICPVCAAKVSEKRKNELHNAIKAHKSNGGHLAMLTLTIRHNRLDKLETLLKAFNDALTNMFRRKQYHEIRKAMGLIGRVKALEVTHGKNGWHPHAHIVIFYENEIDLKEYEKKIFRLWDLACNSLGLSTTQRYGIDLQGADQVQAYLTKQGNWSIEQEMTKSHIKKGKESLTPFDLLRDVLQNDDDYSKALFKEYATAFKGKMQLHWSKGLKDRFAISEKTDEELAKEKVEQADVLGLLNSSQWKEIIRLDQRAQLLNNIELFGFNVGVAITLTNLLK